MNPIRGKDVIIEMSVDGVYYPVLCGTDCTFNTTPEFIEKTSATSGLFREFEKRLEEWTMSVNGLSYVENSTTLSFFYMLQTSVRRSDQAFRMTFVDENTDSIAIIGRAFIGESSITGPASDFANASISLKGNGAFTMAVVPPPVPADTFEVLADWWLPNAGTSSITGASTGNTDGTNYTLTEDDELLQVVVENMQMYEVNGTPQAGEPQYQFAGGTVVFAMEFDGSQKVFIMFKRPV